MSMSSGAERALAALAKIATEFSALTVSLPEFLNRVLGVLGEDIGFDTCLVALLDEKGTGRLTVRAASGLAAARLGKSLPPGIHENVMATGQAVMVPDLQANAGHADPDFRSCICAPVLVRGRAIGVLNAYRPVPGAFAEQDVNLIVIVARYFSSAIELARLHERPPLVTSADPLTDLPADSAFHEALERELRRGRRHEQPLAVLCMDIDNLAAIRERHGSARGDAVLRSVANVLRWMLRDSDVIARSQDGFLLLLPQTPKRAAVSVAERIRQRAKTVAADGGPDVTVSLGVSEAPHDGATSDAVLAIAKQALEDAKRHGGNRVEAGRSAP